MTEEKIDLDEVRLLFRCPACNAAPREWCVTYRPTRLPKGTTTYFLHESRGRIVQLYGRQQYNEGWLDGLDSALHGPQWAREALRRAGRTLTPAQESRGFLDTLGAADQAQVIALLPHLLTTVRNLWSSLPVDVRRMLLEEVKRG